MSASDVIVTLTGGLVVPVEVISRMIDLEDRGASFHLESDGRFRVSPATLLTAADVQFLRSHKDLVREAVAYCESAAVM